MDTKLTLKLNQEIIHKAKIYAAQKKVSLSRIIENYLNSITNEAKSDNSIEISPFVKSMRTGNKIPVDLDYKTEYSENLLSKYK
jgi:nucleoid DNA-binding protein